MHCSLLTSCQLNPMPKLWQNIFPFQSLMISSSMKKKKVNSCVPHFMSGWTGHFIVKINEGLSRRIKCMAPKCNTICDESVVRALVSIEHPDLAEKFERFLLESYIEDNNTVKWCPSIPNCGNAIRVKGDAICEVECTCGIQFCFACLKEAHSPCSCLMWELWIKKCRDESETVNWITVNTKPCPKCHKPVDKNGGCNLVVCICGQAFWYVQLSLLLCYFLCLITL
jgi:ariadne-1